MIDWSLWTNTMITKVTIVQQNILHGGAEKCLGKLTSIKSA